MEECFRDISRMCVPKYGTVCEGKTERPLQAMGVVLRHAISVQLCWKHRWRFIYDMFIWMYVCAHMRRVTQIHTVGVCTDRHILPPSSHLSLSKFHSFVPALLSQHPLSKGKALFVQPVNTILENAIFEMHAG